MILTLSTLTLGPKSTLTPMNEEEALSMLLSHRDVQRSRSKTEAPALRIAARPTQACT